MASDLIDPVDVGHEFGGDLQLSPTGDLARVNLVDRSRQRVLRRLLTNPGDYIAHVSYGAGVPASIGQISDPVKIGATIRGQMLREASVVQSPGPVATVQALPNGVAASISYLVAPDKTPAVLSFSVSE